MRNRQVHLVEVGARDGLQNEAMTLSVALRAELVNRLVRAGLTHIEVGSFVSPKWVPQMADSDRVFAQIERRAGVTYSALVPNEKGGAMALAAAADEIAVFTAASESFCQRNINCSIAESIERFRPVVEQAKSAGKPVRGYVSCIAACPYEGRISPTAVAKTTEHLLALGITDISFGDTIGVARPNDIHAVLTAIASIVPTAKTGLHLHNTYGMAIANIYASLERGIRIFDSSIAGLGGCPYAPGASGNVATEDVVWLLEGEGLHTGVDIDALAQVGDWISSQLQRPNRSGTGLARTAKLAHSQQS